MNLLCLKPEESHEWHDPLSRWASATANTKVLEWILVWFCSSFFSYLFILRSRHIEYQGLWYQKKYQLWSSHPTLGNHERASSMQHRIVCRESGSWSIEWFQLSYSHYLLLTEGQSLCLKEDKALLPKGAASRSNTGHFHCQVPSADRTDHRAGEWGEDSYLSSISGRGKIIHCHIPKPSLFSECQNVQLCSFPVLFSTSTRDTFPSKTPWMSHDSRS